MSDSVGYTPGSGAEIAVDEIAGIKHQRVKVQIGVDGTATDVNAANPMPITAPDGIAITGALTDAELRASAVPVSGPLTDAQLRAEPLRISAEDSEWLLSQIVSLLTSPAGFDRSQSRARVTAILESGTVSTVSTVNAIAALNNFGGLPAEAVARHQNLAAWQLCHRSTIS